LRVPAHSNALKQSNAESSSSASKSYSGHIYFSAFLKSKTKAVESIGQKQPDTVEKIDVSPEKDSKNLSTTEELGDCSILFNSPVVSPDLSKRDDADVAPVEPPILPPLQRLTTPDFFSTPSPLRSSLCDSPLPASSYVHQGLCYPLPFNFDFGLQGGFSPIRAMTPTGFQTAQNTSPLSDSLHSHDSFFENFLMENGSNVHN
jgi:hypothetical protein